MKLLLEQFKQRRKTLGLKQSDMWLKVGMARQQYQRLESRGNPRLDTLDLVAQGLVGRLMFIPNEKLDAVRALLEAESMPSDDGKGQPGESRPSLVNDPWQGLLGNEK